MPIETALGPHKAAGLMGVRMSELTAFVLVQHGSMPKIYVDMNVTIKLY